MPSTTPKLLGQKKPAADVETVLFTVASGHQVQFSVFVCNQSPVLDRFTVALIPNGGTLNAANYIAYNTPLIGNGVFSASGLFLGSGDKVEVTSGGGNVSITATGIDITP